VEETRLHLLLSIVRALNCRIISKNTCVLKKKKPNKSCANFSVSYFIFQVSRKKSFITISNHWI
jgi:hypothetical protein